VRDILHAAPPSAKIPDDYPAQFDAFVSFIRSRGVNIRTTFSKAGGLGTGRITREQFLAILKSFGTDLPVSDFEQIIDLFKQQDGLYSYWTFCQTVDAYELKPQINSSRKISAHPPSRAVVEKLHILLKERRISAGDFFPSDHSQIGQPRLIRILAGMRVSVDAQDIRDLMALYGDENDMFDYERFIEDVAVKVVPQVCNVDDVLERLRDFLITNKKTLSSAIVRYDREGSGWVTVRDLKAAFHFLQFKITEQEALVLADAFPFPDGKNEVSWKDLCAKCDPDPTLFGPTEWQINRARLQEEVVASNQALPAHIISIIKRILAVAPTIDQSFIDLDPRNQGRLPQTDFLRVLKDVEGLSLSPTDVSKLLGFYRLSGSPEINYLALCRDLKGAVNFPVVEEVAEEMRPLRVEPEIKVPELSLPIRALVKRFKQFVIRKGVSANSVFEQYDGNRLGYVHPAKVGQILAASGFETLREELENLCRTFRDVTRPELFAYRIFGAAVDREDVSGEECVSSPGCAALPGDVEREVAANLVHIREKLLARNRRVGALFTGVQEDVVSAAEFQRRLEGLHILLKSNQIQGILRKYRVGVGSGDVDWKAFCRDVERSRTIGV
jgi:Ca2+-binding EF-hand superfamily protein